MNVEFKAEMCDPNNNVLLGFAMTKLDELKFNSSSGYVKTGNKQLNFDIGFLLFKIRIVYTYKNINDGTNISFEH